MFNNVDFIVLYSTIQLGGIQNFVSEIRNEWIHHVNTASLKPLIQHHQAGLGCLESFDMQLQLPIIKWPKEKKDIFVHAKITNEFSADPLSGNSHSQLVNKKRYQLFTVRWKNLGP